MNNHVGQGPLAHNKEEWMERADLMLELADSPIELQRLISLHASRTPLTTVLEESGTLDSVRIYSSRLRDHGDAAVIERNMLSICEQFSPDILQTYLLDECRRHAECALYVSPGKFFTKTPLHGMVLYKDDAVQIHYMQVLPSEPRPATGLETGITVNGADSLILFVKATECQYRVFDVETDSCTSPTLSEPIFRSASSSEHIFLKGGRQGMHLLPQPHALTMIVCLSNLPRTDATQHFSLKSGSLVGLSAANVEDSRLQVLTTALASIPGTGNVEALINISHHSASFVRWSALRALSSVDADAALKRLTEMKEQDEDAEIRCLAAECLAEG